MATTNSIPTGTDDPLIPLAINQVFTFAPEAFGFQDVDSGNSLQFVKITTLPLAGSLTWNNGTSDAAVTQDQIISVTDISAGKLKFTPALNSIGFPYAVIGFNVSDGTDYSVNSNTLTFGVDDNYAADISTTGVVTVGGSVTGAIATNGDQDWFKVSLTAGVNYQIDQEGYYANPSQGTLAYPYLVGIYNSSGTSLSLGNFSWIGSNARINFIPPATGDYFLSATSSDYGTGTYRLSIKQNQFTPTFNNSLGGVVSYTEGNPAIALDTVVTISDADNVTSYNGASLTLSGNSQDVFSASGALSFFNGDVIITNSGTPTTIGTVTSNSNGYLTILFNANATQSLVNQALSSLAYNNVSSTPPASSIVNWVFSDGNTIATGITTVNITSVSDSNTAPTATSSSFVAYKNDNFSSIYLSGSDNESGIRSFKITTLPAHGTLYSDSSLTTAIDTNTVITATGDSAFIYFKPTTDFSGSDTLQYVAVDSDSSPITSAPATDTIAIQDAQRPPNHLVTGLGGIAGFGENTHSRNDDQPTGFIDVKTAGVFPSGIKFGGITYDGFYINNNGMVTFGNSTYDFTPNGLSSGVHYGSGLLPAIALYWTDLDTYRPLTASLDGNSTGSNLVYWDLDAVNKNIIITWDDVEEFSDGGKPVIAGQIILHDAGGGNMDITFRYEYADTLARHTVTAGWNVGKSSGIEGSDYYEIPNASGTTTGGNNVLADLDTRVGNTGKVGVWEFALRDGGIYIATGSTTVFTEQTPIAVDSAITISSAGIWNNGTLKVQITGNPTADDALHLDVFVDGAAHTGIWIDARSGSKLLMSNATPIGTANLENVSNGAEWIFTFNESATTQSVQDTARAIRFYNNSDTPDPTQRTVTFTVTDVNSSTSLPNTPAVSTQVVGVIKVNDAPTLNLSSATATSNGSTPVVLTSDVTVSDFELDALNNYGGASITLKRNGTASADDVFSVPSDATTLGTVSNSGGILTITFNDGVTKTQVESVLSAITYQNNSATPPLEPVSIDWLFSDGNTSVQGTGGELNATASTSVTISSPTNHVPTGIVTIEGTPTQGQTLTANNTLADANGLGTIAYQWKKTDGSVIATTSTLLMTQAEVGQIITLTASYTDLGGTLESVSSSPTSIVANVNDVPTGTVTITGTLTQGQTLTANNNLVDIDGIPTSGTGEITYQWKAGGNVISGATSNTYVLQLTDVGKTITVTASYTDLGGTNESVESSSTNTVIALNQAPTLTIPYLNQGIAYGKQWNYNLNLASHFSDPENGALTFSIVNKPAWLSVSNGSLVGTPPSKALNQQPFPIQITATDTGGLSTSSNFTVTVLDFDAGNLFQGTTGNESISGTSSIDTITYTASPANLTLTLPSAFENIIGGSGNDTITGGSAVILAGGLGNDVYYIANLTTKILEAPNGGFDEVQSSISYDLSQTKNVEKLTLVEGSAATIATGGNRNETLIGNSANNTLNGGAGKDTMRGGAGNDTYYVDNIGDFISEDASLHGGAGTDTVISSITTLAGYTLPADVENLTLIGRSSRSSMQGTGNGLNNEITASSGGGTLKGLDGNDTLNGGIRNDKLVGGLGADLLQGGLGKNVYIYKNTAESNVSSFDHIVATFDGGTADKIQLASSVSALNVIPTHIDVSGLDVNTLNLALQPQFQSSNLNVAILNTTDSKTFFAIDIDGDAAFTSGDMLIDVTGSALTSVTANSFKVMLPLA